METLKERIEAQKDGTFISVGSNTGFVYQGLKEGAIPFFEGARESCINSLMKRISDFNEQNNETCRHIEHRLRLLVDLVDIPPKGLDSKDVKKQIIKYSDQILTNVSLLQYKQKAIIKYAEEVVNFVPFLEREVVDEYEKEIDPGVALIVEGAEDGAWFSEDPGCRYLYSGKKGWKKGKKI